MAESVYHERNCDFCETTFRPISPRQKFCRYDCRAQASYVKKKASRRSLWKTKNCTICEKEFQAGSPIAKYCSARCRNLANQKQRDRRNGFDEREQLFRETATRCHYCSKEYHPRNIKQKYCNESCKMAHRRVERREARLRYEPIACLVCRCKFTPKNSKNVYCSSECGTVANKRRQQRKRTSICVQCTKVFTTFGSNKNTKVYCSVECRNLGQKTRVARYAEDKLRKKEEMFAKGVKTMVMPHVRGAEAVAIIPTYCKVTKKTKIEGSSDFAEEIEKFLSKGGKIKKLELKVRKNPKSKVQREPVKNQELEIDDNEYPIAPSEIPYF